MINRFKLDRSLATVCLAFTVMFVNNGFIIAGLTSFDSAMLSDLGLSFGSLKLRDTITIVSLGVSVPFVGLLLDRVRIRPIVVAGLLMMAGGFTAYGFVHAAWEMYAAQVLLGASQAFCGLVAHVVLISRWTSVHRGLALGLVVAGSSLGNAVAPTINGLLLAHFAWRDAILCGALVAVALIPVVFLVYRERPAAGDEAGGTAGDGAVVGEVAGAGGEHRVGVPDRHDAMHFAPHDQSASDKHQAATFWLLGIIAGTSVLCVLGLVTNLSLYVSKDLGLSGNAAQELLFALFFASSVTQVLAGLAADRRGALFIHRFMLCLMLAGIAAVLIVPAQNLVLVVVVFGIGWGGNSAMLQLQPVALFPTAVLGRTLGMLAVMETVGGAVAPALVGYGRDLTGSYRASFLGLVLVMVACVVCAGLLRERRSGPTAVGAGLQRAETRCYPPSES